MTNNKDKLNLNFINRFKYEEGLENFFIKLSNSSKPNLVVPVVPKILYFLLFYLFGGQRSFVPLFFRQIGVDPKILGFILLFPPFISFVFSPIWSGLADTHNAHKLVFLSMVFGTGFCFFTLNFVTNHYVVTFIVFLNAVFWAPIIPLADSTTYKILSEPYKELYGKQRLFGSIGFSVSAMLTGALINQFGTVNVAWINYPIAATILLVFTILCFNNQPITNIYHKLNNDNSEVTNSDDNEEIINQEKENLKNNSDDDDDDDDITLGADVDDNQEDEEEEEKDINEDQNRSLSSTGMYNTPSSILLSSPTLGSFDEEYINNEQVKQSLKDKEIKLKKEEIKIAINPIQPEEKVSFVKGVRVLISNSKILVILFNSVIVACGMSVCNNYLALAITDPRYFNGPYSLVGLASILNVTFEVIFFFFGKQLLFKIGIFKLVVISHLAVTIRVIAYCFILKLRLSAWSIVPVELLHGVCFASIWNSGSTIINNNSPPGLSATGQSLFFGVYMGIGTGLGALAGGYLYSDYGAITMFQFVAAIVLFGLVIFLITEFLLNKRLVSSNNSNNGNTNHNSNNSNSHNLNKSKNSINHYNSSNNPNHNGNSNHTNDIEMKSVSSLNNIHNNNNNNINNKNQININNNLITKNKSLDNIILSKIALDGDYNDEEESLKFNQLLKEQLEREREREKEQKLLEQEEQLTYDQLDVINNTNNIDMKEISFS